MIRSFNSKETEKIWNGEFSKKLPNEDIKGRVVSLGTGAFGYGGY